MTAIPEGVKQATGQRTTKSQNLSSSLHAPAHARLFETLTDYGLIEQLGDEFILTPAVAAPEFEPIPATRNDAPKWPFHQGPDDTIEAYLKRTQSFGMLGIARDGQNLTRNKVRKALAEQQRQKQTTK